MGTRSNWIMDQLRHILIYMPLALTKTLITIFVSSVHMLKAMQQQPKEPEPQNLQVKTSFLIVIPPHGKP